MLVLYLQATWQGGVLCANFSRFVFGFACASFFVRACEISRPRRASPEQGRGGRPRRGLMESPSILNPSIRGSSIQPLRGRQSINPSIRQSYQSASPHTSTGRREIDLTRSYTVPRCNSQHISIGAPTQPSPSADVLDLRGEKRVHRNQTKRNAVLMVMLLAVFFTGSMRYPTERWSSRCS